MCKKVSRRTNVRHDDATVREATVGQSDGTDVRGLLKGERNGRTDGATVATARKAAVVQTIGTNGTTVQQCLLGSVVRRLCERDGRDGRCAVTTAREAAVARDGRNERHGRFNSISLDLLSTDPLRWLAVGSVA